MDVLNVGQFLNVKIYPGSSVFCLPTQAYVHKSVMEELKRIIDDSEITKEDDALWPPPDRVGRQVCDSIQYCKLTNPAAIAVHLRGSYTRQIFYPFLCCFDMWLPYDLMLFKWGQKCRILIKHPSFQHFSST